MRDPGDRATPRSDVADSRCRMYSAPANSRANIYRFCAFPDTTNGPLHADAADPAHRQSYKTDHHWNCRVRNLRRPSPYARIGHRRTINNARRASSYRTYRKTKAEDPPVSWRFVGDPDPIYREATSQPLAGLLGVAHLLPRHLYQSRAPVHRCGGTGW
jgi:hypothetical protein